MYTVSIGNASKSDKRKQKTGEEHKSAIMKDGNCRVDGI